MTPYAGTPACGLGVTRGMHEASACRVLPNVCNMAGHFLGGMHTTVQVG